MQKRPYAMQDACFTGALDFSRLLDPPAGRHGFLRAGEDGHFVFEDGTPVRFFGASTVGARCTPEHEAAEAFAAKLASAGMNMLRLHAADSILIDSSEPPTRLLPDRLDKLDYLIYQCKLRGIYIHIDLFVNRHFERARDGLSSTDPDETYKGALKNIQMYDRRLIELQKEFIRQYLSHVNPYTGLSYLEEPAVAVVQLVNENSILWSNGREHPWYDSELDGLWNSWLLNRYGGREGLAAAWTNRRGVCALRPEEDPAAGNVAHIPVGFWNEARIERGQPFNSVAGAARHADYMRFLASLERAFVVELREMLSGLGLRSLVNVSNLSEGPLENAVVSELAEVTEGNSYWNHPLRWDRGMRNCSIRMNNRDPRIFPSQYNFTTHMVTDLARRTVSGHPFLIGEFNACYQTIFKGDAMLTMTAYASLQDWDGLLFFAVGPETPGKLASFEGGSDPAVFGVAGLCAAVFYERRIQSARNLVEIVHAPADALLLWKYWETHFGFLPYISRVRCVYTGEDGKYKGGAELAVASGCTTAADLSGAAHSLAFSARPWCDEREGDDDRAAYRAAQGGAGDETMGITAFEGTIPLTFDGGHAYLDDVSHIERDPLAESRIADRVMKRFGLLGEEQGLGAEECFRSDTGELCLDHANGHFSVSADSLRALTGDMAGGRETKGFSCRVENGEAALVLLSLDGEPTERSAHLLLTAIGQFENSGEEFTDGFMTREGSLPILTDEIRGEARISSCYPSATVYVLSSAGERLRELSLTARDGVFVLPLGEREECAVNYELECR